MSTNPLKKIDLEKGIFQANGKTYFIESSLTIERYVEFQILEKELGFGVSFKAMFDGLNELWGYLNKMQFAEAAVKLNNMLRGMAKIEEKEPAVLKICALYINEESEDRSVITQDMITHKIQDWKAEGYDMRDFFQLAFTLVPGFIDAYQRVSRIISGLEKPGAKAKGQPQETK